MGHGGTTVVQETRQRAEGIVVGHPEGQGHCGMVWGHAIHGYAVPAPQGHGGKGVLFQ